jgi:hypothetical protein
VADFRLVLAVRGGRAPQRLGQIGRGIGLKARGTLQLKRYPPLCTGRNG